MNEDPKALPAGIVSLNEAVFEIDPDDVTVESLEERLELTLALPFTGSTCQEFVCATYGPPPE